MRGYLHRPRRSLHVHQHDSDADSKTDRSTRDQWGDVSESTQEQPAERRTDPDRGISRESPDCLRRSHRRGLRSRSKRTGAHPTVNVVRRKAAPQRRHTRDGQNDDRAGGNTWRYVCLSDDQARPGAHDGGSTDEYPAHTLELQIAGVCQGGSTRCHVRVTSRAPLPESRCDRGEFPVPACIWPAAMEVTQSDGVMPPTPVWGRLRITIFSDRARINLASDSRRL